MQELLQYAEAQRGDMVAVIRQLVDAESPSDNKQAADRCGELIARELERRGASVRRHQQRERGDTLEARFATARGGKPVVLLGHYDTVWDVGTLAHMPWGERDGRLFGPGVFDMKSGIAIMLFALQAMQKVRGGLPRPVTILLNADEEVGSEGSRAVIEKLAQESEAVLVVEPAQGTSVKTARKGVGGFTIKVTGVAAHAGLDFTKGQNAILELARQIERVSGFTNLNRGLTVNVGIVHGGTKASNVVPAEAMAEVDVRIARLQDREAIERKFRALRPVNRKCRLEVTGGINRPPLERTAKVAALYTKAQAIARELGFELGEAAVGGGSDGNLTAALGIPTLDGLGAVGEGAHAAHESVLVDWLPRRVAMLAGLIEKI